MQKIIKDTLLDIFSELKFWKYYIYRAYLVLESQYKGTKLGILWEPISQSVGAIFISVLWLELMDMNKSDFKAFYFYIFAGFTFWTVINTIIIRGCVYFHNRRDLFYLEGRHLSFYAFELIAETLSRFFLMIGFMMIISVALFDVYFLKNLMLLLYVLISTVVASIGCICFLGVYSFIKRDIREIVRSIMRIAFFMTPVVWSLEKLGDYQDFIWLNPAYTYFLLFRGVFIDNEWTIFALLLNALVSLSLLFLGLMAISKHTDKIMKQSTG